jgi:predicted nucleic acid-binding protein
MIVVSDTSAITALLQVSQIDLLEKLFHEILIPEAVRDELLKNHSSLPSYLHFEQVRNLAEVKRLLVEIDPGEAEAIVLAKERHADILLIDELKGRRVAEREGLRFVGLMGVLVQAKQNHFIISVRELTAELERVAGFRVSEKIKSAAFRKADEL